MRAGVLCADVLCADVLYAGVLAFGLSGRGRPGSIAYPVVVCVETKARLRYRPSLPWNDLQHDQR
jgi:hypothetical protein